MQARLQGDPTSWSWVIFSGAEWIFLGALTPMGVWVRDQRAAAAPRMIELPGDVLQTVLRTDSRHEIPLRDEIRFLEQYLAIEQVRFSDRLHVRWAIAEPLRAALVPEFVL